MAGGKGLVVPLSMDPREWLRGIAVVERSVKDFGSELGDVEDAGDRLEKALADNFRDIERRARDVDIAGNVRGGTKGKLGSVGAEVGDEFVESWGEAVRSGDLSGAFTETMSNAAMIGMAAGPVAGAIGLGVAAIGSIVVQKFQEQQQKIKEAVSSLVQFDWDALIVEAGLKGAELADAARAGLQSRAEDEGRLMAILGLENPEEVYNRLGELEAKTGITADVIAQAFLGNANAQKAVGDAIDANKTKLDELGPPGRNRTAEAVEYTKQLQASQAALGEIATGIDVGKQATDRLIASQAVADQVWQGSNTAVRDIAANLGIGADNAERIGTALRNINGKTYTINIDYQRRVYGATPGLPGYITNADLDGDGLPG